MSKKLQQKKLKRVTKAWPDLQQPVSTRCWFLELECGHVVFRPLRDYTMPPNMVLCTECLEHSNPQNQLESKNNETQPGTPSVSNV